MSTEYRRVTDGQTSRDSIVCAMHTRRAIKIIHAEFLVKTVCSADVNVIAEFAVAGPRAWNSLPSDIRTSTPLFDTFKKHLKSNCLSPACRACDYVYIDYVRRSRSSSCRLLRPINCQTYITLHYITLHYIEIYTAA